MIEWLKYDNDNPPESVIAYITIGVNGIVRHGYHDFERGWIDTMDDPIRRVTHYAEINLPDANP